jgi:hypothetical protein
MDGEGKEEEGMQGRGRKALEVEEREGWMDGWMDGWMEMRRRRRRNDVKSDICFLKGHT